jgi:methylmalonyl-CoA mutase
MSTELTLNEFPKPAAGDWRKAAEETLKGAPFEKKLISKTPEEIDIQPIYDGSAPDNAPPGFAQFVRGSNAAPRAWEIAQEIPFGGPKAFNEALRNDMERGQTAVNVMPDRATRRGLDPDVATAGEVGLCGLSLATTHDFERALGGIDLDKTPVHIEPGSSALPVLALFAAFARGKGKDLAALHGSLDFDPLAELLAEGTLPYSAVMAFDRMAQITKWAAQHAPNFRTIGVHAHTWHDAGGSAVQELAFALSTAVEYLRQLELHEVGINDAASRMRFSFSVGSDFFMGIAKLRAARLLWAKLVAACGGSTDAQRMHIHARTALVNRSKLDPYVNMLRATTEAFAAVAGGCESLHVGAFDEVIRPPDEFSRRIARNTQIILRDECSFHRVIDPAGGSPFVETLTQQLAEKAWALLQEVEARGGMQKALEGGFPQEQVNATFAKRADAIAHRRETLVGVNQYADPTEKPLVSGDFKAAELQKKRAAQIADYRTSPGHIAETAVLMKLGNILESQPSDVVDLAIDAAAHGATLGEIARTLRASSGPSPTITPLPVRRLSEPFEQLRAAAGRNGEKPKVFLANMGPLSQHKARADFSIGFFRAGGFDILDNRGFPDAEKAAEAAIASGAGVVVICSTDDTYPDLVPPLTKAIKAAKPGTHIILAGYPKEHIEAFKQAGVDEFIHIRANCHAVLAGALTKVGVKL